MCRIAAAITAAACALAACHADECTQNGPSLDVEIETGTLGERIQSLELDVDLGSDHYKRIYPVGDSLADSRAAVRILLGRLGAQPGELTLTVRAFEDASGTGQEIAETTQRTAVTPGACNRMIVSLLKERIVCGATCSIACRDAESCLVDCNMSSRCAVDCERAGTCDVACAPGSSCSIDCRGARRCDLVNCGGDAHCALQCDENSSACMFSACGGSETSCGGGIFTCNTPCP
jgi:hypothetical protein